MSSNLYKSGRVVVNREDTRIIDNNVLVEEKLTEVLRVAAKAGEEHTNEEKFDSGLEAENIELLFDTQETGSVIKSASEEEKTALLEEIEAAKGELSDLRQQADQMMEDAKKEIGAMQMKAYEEAKNQGYQEGARLGKAEADAAKAEYENRKKQMETDYQQRINELEPQFIDALTGIYEHIFKVELSGYEGLVVSLLENALLKTEDGRNLLIHVSKADYQEVMENKEGLKAEAGGVALEVIEDMTLDASECYIETENGIYDCSLATQLDELTRKLKLLSYEK